MVDHWVTHRVKTSKTEHSSTTLENAAVQHATMEAVYL
jgi:hypothetical protein